MNQFTQQPSVREEQDSLPCASAVAQQFPETLIDVSSNPIPEQHTVTAAFDLFAAACLPMLAKASPQYNAFLAGVNALKCAVLNTPHSSQSRVVPPVHSANPAAAPAILPLSSPPSCPQAHVPAVTDNIGMCTPSFPKNSLATTVPNERSGKRKAKDPSIAIPTTNTPQMAIENSSPLSTEAFKAFCRSGRISQKYAPQQLQVPSPQTSTTTPRAPKKQKTGMPTHSHATPTGYDSEKDERTSHNQHHEGEHLRQDSIHLRLEALDDFSHGMPMHEVLQKYNISSHKCLKRWAKEYGGGRYDECSTWSLQTKKKHV